MTGALEYARYEIDVFHVGEDLTIEFWYFSENRAAADLWSS